MYTVVQTPVFDKMVQTLLSQAEQDELAVFLANYPESGDVIPQSGGCRKLRWQAKGQGKRGGSRVIYFNRLQNGKIYLLLIYAKAKTDNIPAHLLKQTKEEIEKWL